MGVEYKELGGVRTIVEGDKVLLCGSDVAKAARLSKFELRRSAALQKCNFKMYYRFGRASARNAVHPRKRPVPAGVQFKALPWIKDSAQWDGVTICGSIGYEQQHTSVISLKLELLTKYYSEKSCTKTSEKMRVMKRRTRPFSFFLCVFCRTLLAILDFVSTTKLQHIQLLLHLKLLITLFHFRNIHINQLVSNTGSFYIILGTVHIPGSRTATIWHCGYKSATILIFNIIFR